jgi:hypothetical protein
MIKTAAQNIDDLLGAYLGKGVGERETVEHVHAHIDPPTSRLNLSLKGYRDEHVAGASVDVDVDYAWAAVDFTCNPQDEKLAAVIALAAARYILDAYTINRPATPVEWDRFRHHPNGDFGWPAWLVGLEWRRDVSGGPRFMALVSPYLWDLVGGGRAEFSSAL